MLWSEEVGRKESTTRRAVGEKTTDGERNGSFVITVSVMTS